jgi:hypothetical protein
VSYRVIVLPGLYLVRKNELQKLGN